MVFMQGMVWAQQQDMLEQQRMMEHRAMMEQQRMMEAQMGGYMGIKPPKVHNPSMTEIVNYLAGMLQASEVVLIDGFDTHKTRHICKGSKRVLVLDRCVSSLYVPSGTLYIEYFVCPNCRKVLVNKSSIKTV